LPGAASVLRPGRRDLAAQFTSYRKIPAPWTKNGRRSWKNDSNAVRLRTAGSASTWPKSGLIVASSVRFGAIPYFRSAPPVTLCERSNPPPAATDTFFVTTYGAISGRRGDGRPSSPVSSPSCDETPAWEPRYTGQLTRSEYRSISRHTANPNVPVARAT